MRCLAFRMSQCVLYFLLVNVSSEVKKLNHIAKDVTTAIDCCTPASRPDDKEHLMLIHEHFQICKAYEMGSDQLPWRRMLSKLL